MLNGRARPGSRAALLHAPQTVATLVHPHLDRQRRVGVQVALQLHRAIRNATLPHDGSECRRVNHSQMPV
eukprot:350264-Chlamydomonas_euryale.AAC.5